METIMDNNKRILEVYNFLKITIPKERSCYSAEEKRFEMDHEDILDYFYRGSHDNLVKVFFLSQDILDIQRQGFIVADYLSPGGNWTAYPSKSQKTLQEITDEILDLFQMTFELEIN